MVGPQRISVGLVLTAACFVYGSFLLSWVVQKLFVEAILSRRQFDAGARISIARLIHYILVTTGFLLALVVLGLELTKLTIVLSALGIGIGFGLQAIVNNFICGIILLFERPVRVGDFIEVGGEWVVVKKIGLRSTTVQNFDWADVIVPNGDLITNQVVNWTLSDRSVRIVIPVGVERGSDVPLVMETLRQCAASNEKVSKLPEPMILFTGFGESALTFELRVWTLDVSDKLELDSALHQEINRKFQEAGIAIAFPQRDIHIRSAEEDAASSLKGDAGYQSDNRVDSGMEDEEK
jgi:small-conductance mechanosensitive channel